MGTPRKRGFSTTMDSKDEDHYSKCQGEGTEEHRDLGLEEARGSGG